MSIISIKRFLPAVRSLVCTHDKIADLIQEQETLLNELLENDRFANMTKDHLKTALLLLQDYTESLKATGKNSHKDITPSSHPE